MSALNWGVIQDGGTFESLMHAILYTEDSGTVPFGRPGKDAGQDARSADGTVIYQAKYRQQLTMDGAIQLALEELEKIKEYRKSTHPNSRHWQRGRRWILVANILTNPNDDAEWQIRVVPEFHKEGLVADYWGMKTLEGKLAQHAHIREVFFEGENRILVGLKEAHDRLINECIGGSSLINPLVGREKVMQAIKDFVAANEKRVLPVVGPAGIGKSRLMYEALVQLGRDGWRVLWALPEAMSQSSRWFQLLNSNQPTCVAIDDPADPDLLAAIVEQLAPVERRNWKVIVACRSSQAELLRRYQKLPMLADAVMLMPLDEAHSKELLKSNLNGSIPEDQFHTIFKHTGGTPGWLCLVAELGNRDALRKLPQTVDDIASLYVEDCLSKLEAADRDKGQRLLRYLALWGTLALNPNTEDQPQAQFLDTQGVNESDLRRLIERFVNAGIVRNWGVGRRLFAIQPLIIREHVLSSWLFNGDGEEYSVNVEGKRIVDLLVHGKIPLAELALRSISHLTRSRLEASQGYSFVKPVFDEFLLIARDRTVIDQSRLLPLIEILSMSDPESALDTIKAIREHDKPTVEVMDPFWGKTAFAHTSVVAKLPWLLFKTAAFVHERVVASRYLEEFRQLFTMEKVLQEEAETGQQPRKLLERLLCESRNSGLFVEPAYEIIIQEIGRQGSWPFVGILLECLLNPDRERLDWTAQWTLTLHRWSIVPNSPEWNMAAALRDKAFTILRQEKEQNLRPEIWRILTGSHQRFHRLLLNESTGKAIVDAYRGVLISDLTTCATILEKPPIELTLEECVAARSMWSWYLEYEKSDDLAKLAQRCEKAYNRMSKWRPQDFFRFDTDEALAPETERVANLLRSANDTSPFVEFFAEAKAYLDAARAGGQDMADSGRIAILADALIDIFTPFNIIPTAQITLYVAKVLQQPEVTNELAWSFAVRICQKHLLRIKRNGDESQIEDELKSLVAKCHDKGQFLFALYSNAHPLNTGVLNRSELERLFAEETQFTDRQRFVLLGVFAPAHWEVVKPRLNRCCGSLNGQRPELSNCVALFIRMMHLIALRYGLQDLKPQIEWIIEVIIQHDLNGELLGMHEFKWLRDHSNFRLDMSQFVRLMRSRIQTEEKARPDGSFRILPFEFQVRDWCRFDLSQTAEAKAFEEFCGLALGTGYIAMHWMPKFIAEMDPSGLQVASFVERHLKENPSISGDALARLGYIASAYADSSVAWSNIANHICANAGRLTRDEREHVFFGLARKETGVLSSAPGEVPEYYVQVRDLAVRMRNAEPPDSPLLGYREWALRLAQENLHRERQRAEEVDHG